MCGPCATRPREPCQAGDRAALSGSFCVPQPACTSMFRNFSLGEFAMEFFSILKRRTKRVIICIGRALKEALAVQSVLMMILIVFSYFYFGGQVRYIDIIAAMTAFLAFTWTVFTFRELSKYGMKIFHRYDDDIIGEAFADMSRKSVLFEKGLEAFCNGEIRYALNLFTELDTGSYEKTDREKGILALYRGRCYHMMGIYPNAVLSYEKAEKSGVLSEPVRLFMASCCGKNGNIRQALEIYSSFLDSDSIYAGVIRTETGHMYLNMGDTENAAKWFHEAVERHENYAEALGGLALTYAMLGKYEESEKYFCEAVLNRISNADDFIKHYKELRTAAELSDTQSSKGGESNV